MKTLKTIKHKYIIISSLLLIFFASCITYASIYHVNPGPKYQTVYIRIWLEGSDPDEDSVYGWSLAAGDYVDFTDDIPPQYRYELDDIVTEEW